MKTMEGGSQMRWEKQVSSKLSQDRNSADGLLTHQKLKCVTSTTAQPCHCHRPSRELTFEAEVYSKTQYKNWWRSPRTAQ
jgi:hypothetical protein